MSTFDFKKFLLENKLGVYSKAKLNENDYDQLDQAISVAERLLLSMDEESVMYTIEDQFPGINVADVMKYAKGGSAVSMEAQESEEDPTSSVDPDNPYGMAGQSILQIEEDGITEGDEDLKRDLIGKYGKNITVGDIKSEYPGMEDRDAGQLLRRLGLGIDMLKRTPKGGMRRDYGTGPTTGRTAGDALKQAQENVMLKNLDQKFGDFLYLKNKIMDSATSAQHFVNILNKVLDNKREKAGVEKGSNRYTLSPKETEYAKGLWKPKSSASKLGEGEEGPVTDYGQRRQEHSPNPELDAMTMEFINQVFAEFEGGGYTKADAVSAIAQSLVRLKSKV